MLILVLWTKSSIIMNISFFFLNYFKHIFENNQGDFYPYDIYTEYKITKEELLDISPKIKSWFITKQKHNK